MTKRTNILIMVLFTLGTVFSVIPGSTQPSLSHQTDIKLHTRDIANDEIVVAMDLLMQARVHEAQAYVDSLENECAGEPLYLVTRARVLLASITTLDDGKDHVKRLSQPVLAVLDEVIDVCKKRMDADDNDPNLVLYRGWAWMQKAHLRAVCRDFYTAGRDAGRGKKDLESYLAQFPDDPTANGLLGGYLYFSAAVPKVFKLLSALLFLPSGDRGRGLEMMHHSAEEGGPFGIDYRLTLNFVYLFFEGRFEEGFAGTEALLDRYPNNTRMLIGLSMGSLYAPSRYAEYDLRIKRMIAGVNAGNHRDVDWGAFYTVMTNRAYAARYLSNPALAQAQFRSIIHESPNHPDWAEGFARFELGQMYASDGRVDDARKLFESIIGDRQHERFHDPARDMLDDLDRLYGLVKIPPDTPNGLWIETLYRMNPDSLEALATRFDRRSTASLPFAFYTGECRWLLEDYDGALRSYNSVLEWNAPAWHNTYRMVAATRIAEIHALEGDYQRAAEYQERALEYYQNEFRVDWVLEGRKRYFVRLAEGKEALPVPKLLLRQR